MLLVFFLCCYLRISVVDVLNLFRFFCMFFGAVLGGFFCVSAYAISLFLIG